MTHKEINMFLSSFNTQSYNKEQIGNDKAIIINIYEFLKRLNLTEDKITELILHIAYYNKREVKLPVFLEILSKSLSYDTVYDLKDILDISYRVHNLYEDNLVDLTDYVHETNDYRLRDLFLYHNKYVIKRFYEEETLRYIDELKLAAAIELDKNEYKDFTDVVNNIEKKTYSPITNLNTYLRIRSNITGLAKLFWDIFFGNEYLVALVKNNLNVAEIYEKNFTTTVEKPKKVQEPVQLNIFTYEDVEEKQTFENVNAYQISYIFESDKLPQLELEKDIIDYYKSLLENKQSIVLPKLNDKKYTSYVYETNF